MDGAAVSGEGRLKPFQCGTNIRGCHEPLSQDFSETIILAIDFESGLKLRRIDSPLRQIRDIPHGGDCYSHIEASPIRIRGQRPGLAQPGRLNWQKAPSRKGPICAILRRASARALECRLEAVGLDFISIGYTTY